MAPGLTGLGLAARTLARGGGIPVPVDVAVEAFERVAALGDQDEAGRGGSGRKGGLCVGRVVEGGNEGRLGRGDDGRRGDAGEHGSFDRDSCLDGRGREIGCR